MKLLIAALATETNSFSPIPIGRISFEETFVSRKATDLPPNLFSAPLHEWRKAATARGWDVVESLSAFAQPAGPTVRAVYESYRDEILADIKAAKPDVILLSMHGAMIADGYDDCEGDLLARTRAITGPETIIGAELDPHNHLTDTMLDNADLIICFKEYPHTDSPDRARELFALAADAATGKINPVMRDFDCRMMAMYHTPQPPMRGFVEAMQAREGQGGILSLSLCHGFPWGDVPRVGTRMLAITDGDGDQAAQVAQEFGGRLWDMRHDLHQDWPDIDAALDRVDAAQEYPMVLADYSDNAGGGAPSDATFMLRRVIDRGMQDIALGLFWDPILVRMCREVGTGGTLDVRLGGKVGTMSGDPVDLRVKIHAVKEDMTQPMGDTVMAMGNGVWLESNGIHIVACDIRTQCFHPAAFGDLGVPLSQMKAIVVKSSQHFYAGFAPIASEVIHVATPGTLTPDIANIPHTRRDNNFWPKSETPFS